MKWRLLILLLLMPLLSEASLFLRDNFKHAKSGDFIVISQGKTYSLLLISDVNPNKISLEEISFPGNARGQILNSWNEWVNTGAPGHTLWVRYGIDLNTGALQDCYSFTHQNWYQIPEADNYLGTLMNLRLEKMPLSHRKKVGPRSTEAHDERRFWQPKMVVEGQVIPNISFDAWRTHWPRDNSELSGRAIEIYLPEKQDTYPSYFPYWLEIGGGVIGKAKIRIIDSGSGLNSPKPKNP